MNKPSSERQEWWTEQDVDGCWHIGSGNRGFADLGEGPEAEATAKAIKDAHNAAIAKAQPQRSEYDVNVLSSVHDATGACIGFTNAPVSDAASSEPEAVYTKQKGHQPFD